ncbi:MAG: prepilin-type N-terminal cleavage/methylation domain-containing protein [Burkholderiaceae bacterium]
MKATRGFTLIELLVTLVLVSLVASISVPLYEVTSTRLREAELRAALRQIRTAIDAYKAAADSGLIAKGAAESGYPPSLEVLVQGIDAQNMAGGRRLVFLRQVPRDPFFPEQAAPPALHWATRSYGSPPDDPRPGDDVFDVASRSARVGLNGIDYREW